jgi:hypothetical protein
MIVTLLKFQVEHKGMFHVCQWEIEIGVPSSVGLQAARTNSREACEYPCVDLADDQGC